MDAMDFVWIYDFVWKNQTINPFLMNLGLKEPYLVYWQFWITFEVVLVWFCG